MAKIHINFDVERTLTPAVTYVEDRNSMSPRHTKWKKRSNVYKADASQVTNLLHTNINLLTQNNIAQK